MNRYPENIVIQGICNQKLLITESTLVPFKPNNPHKVYIYDLDIDFGGILGLDFLIHYCCTVTGLLSTQLDYINKVFIETRTEKIKLKCNLSNTDAILKIQ